MENRLEILELERKLAMINEKEIREELDNMQVFDRLTSEKMTPYFLNLAKKGQKAESTSSIRSDLGEEFADPGANRAFISNFYQNLYKKPAEQKVVTVGDINDFLGDCGREPEVESSKLSD
jgi:hypothetical protein